MIVVFRCFSLFQQFAHGHCKWRLLSPRLHRNSDTTREGKRLKRKAVIHYTCSTIITQSTHKRIMMVQRPRQSHFFPLLSDICCFQSRMCRTELDTKPWIGDSRKLKCNQSSSISTPDSLLQLNPTILEEEKIYNLEKKNLPKPKKEISTEAGARWRRTSVCAVTTAHKILRDSWWYI